MKCPKCGAELMVRQTYKAGDDAVVRNLVCTGKLCAAVVVTQTSLVLVTVNPARGQGAYSLAKKLRGRKEAPRA